eukprot:gene46204-61790_t
MVCGAQGGGEGGYGGCIHASIDVIPSQILYIFVGSQGNNSKGGFNGGGDGHCSSDDSSCEVYGYGGGGSSDIRTDVNDLRSRLVVGGGGGGAGSDVTGTNNGLNGGMDGGNILSGSSDGGGGGGGGVNGGVGGSSYTVGTLISNHP